MLGEKRTLCADEDVASRGTNLNPLELQALLLLSGGSCQLVSSCSKIKTEEDPAQRVSDPAFLAKAPRSSHPKGLAHRSPP